MNSTVSSVYSKQEIDFFRALSSLNLRADGRTRYQNKNFVITENILPSCLASIECKGKEAEIIISLKGDISDTFSDIKINCDNVNKPLTSSSLFANKDKDSGETQEITAYIEKFILSKIDKKYLQINNSNYYWNFTISIFSLERVYFHNLQIISYGINYLLKTSRLPKVEVICNLVSKERQIIVKEGEYETLNIPTDKLYVVGIHNNGLLLDPNVEELKVVESLMIISVNTDKETIKISNFEVFGSTIDMTKIENLDNFLNDCLN